GQWPQFVYGLPELQIADRANLVDVLFRKAFDNGLADRPFLRSERITLTYADALERVRRIAQVLTEDFPLVPGHRVLLRGGNSIGMALAWLGVVYAGMVAVATMPLLRAKELGDIIEKARPALALCDASLLEELETAWSGHAAQGDIVMFNAMSTPGSLAVRSAAKDGNARPCDVLADDAALLAFTSGTTGQPKAAVHTHRDVLAACETEAMVQRIHRVGATILYTAPTFYRQMASFAKLRGTPSLRLCVSAGENLPDATRQLWKDATGIAIVDGIGATEMFHIFISSAGANVRRGAIGKVVPGYTAKVVDDNGSEVPPGVVGKLAVIGPTGCRYLDDPRQAHYVKDGWNYPGDAFTQDAEGYFFFQARADDMIITSGYNVAGPEVEGALLAHPAVAECAVIGVSDAMRGMVVKAFVVLKPTETAGDAMVQLLQDHVKSTLAPFKYPRQIEFRHELPRTPTGKLQRFKLRTP
ncbi:MAG: 2-aminobenzoate-CoA ligase, partial [Polaromonas sp. 35-63-240]